MPIYPKDVEFIQMRDEALKQKNSKVYGLIWTVSLLITVFLIIGFVSLVHAEIPDETAVNCIVGEAANQGETGMYALASGLLNRGTTKGVYGCKNPNIKTEPKWVFDMAKKALAKAKVKRLHNGDMWENIGAFGKPNWDFSKLVKVYEYKDHIFFKEIK